MLNWLGDTFQAYCNTYETHAMATHHGDTGQPLDWDATPNGKDTDANTLHNYHHENVDNFEDIEQENHTNLATLTQELDDLYHSAQAGEGPPAEALHHIECKLLKIINSPLPVSTTGTF